MPPMTSPSASLQDFCPQCGIELPWISPELCPGCHEPLPAPKKPADAGPPVTEPAPAVAAAPAISAAPALAPGAIADAAGPVSPSPAPAFQAPAAPVAGAAARRRPVLVATVVGAVTALSVFVVLFWTFRDGTGSNSQNPSSVAPADSSRLSSDAGGVPTANRGPMMLPPASTPSGSAPGGMPAANGLAAGGGAAASSLSQADASTLTAAGRPGLSAGGISPGGKTAPAGTPAGTTLVGKAPAGAAASVDSAAEGTSPVQIYWRFGTDEYFAQHPTAKRGNVPLHDGESASFVRFDVENNGPATVSVTPDLFTLYAEGAFVQPAVASLPGLFQGANVPPHGGVRGWLLFIKPWWDRGTQKLNSNLSVSGIPGASVTLSDKGAGASR